MTDRGRRTYDTVSSQAVSSAVSGTVAWDLTEALEKRKGIGKEMREQREALIIEGNAYYEIDLDCVERRKRQEEGRSDREEGISSGAGGKAEKTIHRQR